MCEVWYIRILGVVFQSSTQPIIHMDDTSKLAFVPDTQQLTRLYHVCYCTRTIQLCNFSTIRPDDYILYRPCKLIGCVRLTRTIQRRPLA